MILDEEAHAAAVKAKIQAQLNTIGTTEHPQVYDLDDVPSPRPDDYVTVVVYCRPGGESRQDGYVGTRGWRIETQVVAQKLTAARTLRKAVSDALLFQKLTVSGEETTFVLFETEEPIAETNDTYVGQTDWTYV